MPWIQLTVHPAPVDVDGLVGDLAETAARAIGLGAEDVVVLVTSAAASSRAGAVVSVSGRARGAAEEGLLVSAVRGVVAEWCGLDPDLVSVVRLAPPQAV